MTSVVDPPLKGRRVVTTRDEPGELDRLLVEAGADVVHVPLIEIVDVAGGGSAIDAAFETADRVDWVVVTSRHGAERVGDAVARRPHLRLAAVGTRTAADLARLAGRAVDVVPGRQTAADLVAAMPIEGAGQVVVVAQADGADRDPCRRPVGARLRGARHPLPHRAADAIAGRAARLRSAPTPWPSPADRRRRRGPTRSAARHRRS